MMPQGAGPIYPGSFRQVPIVGRMAPTPSGFLHQGNAANMLLNWLLVRRAGGKLLLRIDDMDSARMRMAYLDDIFTTLEWLGLDYDEGPSGSPHFLETWSQHHRLTLYRQWLHRLQAGHHVYACNCSRNDLLARAGSLRYDGHCRMAGRPCLPNLALRLRLPDEACLLHRLNAPSEYLNALATMGDPVIWKKDGLPAYQLTSVADDVHYGINLVARGDDLAASSACQQLLHRCATGQPLPITLLHHPLMKNSSGRKLSKSTARSPQPLKNQYTSQQVLLQAASLLGLPQKKSAAKAADFLEDAQSWAIPAPL